MVKNIKLGLVFLGLVMILCAVFVMAISSSLAPSIAGNGTIIKMLTFNVSDLGTSDNTLTSITVDVIGSALGNVTNITLFDGTTIYYNESGLDSVVVSVGAAISGQINYNVSFIISSSATDNLTVGANVTTITAGTNVSYSTLPYTSGTATIDSLKPSISYGATTTSATNLSQNYIFINISAEDTVSNLDTIILYLYNSTGEQNSSTNASIGLTSAVQSYNFSSLSNGVYYINATVNDSYNHINSSLATRMIRIDTINPVAVASCSPSSANAGNVVTCTCSGTDSNGSDINSSLTTATSTPSTSSTGTFNYVCSVTDNAGNSHSNTASYTIVTDNAYGGSTGYPTYRPSTLKLSEGYKVALAKNFKVSFEVFGESHILTINNISEDSVTITVSSDPVTLEINLGETKKVDSNLDGYYDLSVFLESIVSSKANVVLTSIYEKAPEEVVENVEETAELAEETIEEVIENEGSKMWIILAIVLLVAGFFAVAVILLKKKKEQVA